jgi:hypothetical protein
MLSNHVFSWQLVKQVLRLTDIHYKEILNDERLRPAYIIANAENTALRKQVLCGTSNQYRDSICSDIRDRVYAILALMKDGEWFPVDYAIIKEKLFWLVILASYAVTSTQSKLHSQTGSIAPLHPGVRLRPGEYTHLTYTASTSFEDCWFQTEGTSLWLPFRMAIFLVRVLHKIQHFTQDDLNTISSYGGHDKSTLDEDGDERPTINLDSVLT